jgi:hypothetical protein
MKKLAGVVLFASLLWFGCMAQSGPSDTEEPPKQASSATDTGPVPLAYPYAISTAPHFAVFVEFPRADSIRRIALGDSNYFLAEADKTDPHYAIIKQIRASTAKGKTPVETNMLVYMTSGRVVNIMLKAGKLADPAYSVDYPIPHPKLPQPADDPPPPVPPQKVNPETAREELADKMVAEVKESPKDDAGITAGGLMLRMYRTERLGELALLSFDIENTTKAVMDLEDPQINLVTVAVKTKRRKKAPPAKIEPIELVQSEVSAKQLKPGERAVCLVEFKPPVHDSDQHVVLSVSNRAMADQPAKYRIE